MYFNAKTRITITSKTGTKQLNTIVSVSAHNDTQHIGGDCTVIVPLNCVMKYQDKTTGKTDFINAIPRVDFKSGNKITVQAQYEGMDWINVFEGFITDYIAGTPSTIKCSDYIYWFNQNILDLAYTSITFKQLMQNVLDSVNKSMKLGSKITLDTSISWNLVNISFKRMSPAAILDHFKKECGLNISLSGNSLYCNVASDIKSTVKFETVRNVYESSLQRPDAVFQRYKVTLWLLNDNGTKTSIEASLVYG